MAAMDGKGGAGAGILKPDRPQKSANQPHQQGKGAYVSFMPGVSDSARKEESDRAMTTYTQKAVAFVNSPIDKAQSPESLTRGELVAASIEMYVLNRMERCHGAVSASDEPEMHSLFIKTANSAASAWRMMFYDAEEALGRFAGFAPELEELCRRCGASTMQIEEIVREYSPLVKQLIKDRLDEAAMIAQKPQETVSFMPQVSGQERRRDVKDVMEAYSQELKKFLGGAAVTVRGEPEWKDDILVGVALELYISGRLGECFGVVSSGINPSLDEEFIRVASTAAMRTRMVYLAEDAKNKFDDLTPDLDRLCRSCGLAPVAESSLVLKEYLPKAAKMLP